MSRKITMCLLNMATFWWAMSSIGLAAEPVRVGVMDQQLVMENLPIVPLVSPNVLAGARTELGNFRPALLDHNTLWNFEELYWRRPVAGPRK